MAIDKNQAIIDYLLQCPQIKGTPLYFNLVDARDNTIQIITHSEDKTTNKPYIDGSVEKNYTVDMIVFKSVSDLPIVQASGNQIEIIGTSTDTSTGTDEPFYINENIDDLADAQALLDWIEEQDDIHNYPNFGENCFINEIATTTDTPRVEGINTELSPQLAMYLIEITVNYIDKTKVLWNK